MTILKPFLAHFSLLSGGFEAGIEPRNDFLARISPRELRGCGAREVLGKLKRFKEILKGFFERFRSGPVAFPGGGREGNEGGKIKGEREKN